MGPNRRAQERERAAARAAAEAKRAEAERKAIAEARRSSPSGTPGRPAAGPLVLPDDRRRDCSRLPVAHLLLPGVRASARSTSTLTAPGRARFQASSVGVVPAVLAERAVCEAGNADGGAAVTKRIGRSRVD